ncbi:helix-turn-helix domain-containing protein [Corynebacterium kefirresidentii]|uniref:helix-turn-helix domain-containing protein n=1 Tax=Corynebacterium kefirresidentii TaxID=1979527 RepID=UPI0039AF1942
MTSTRWWQYIEPIISGMTMRDAAKQAGFNQSAFTRWKNGAKADPDFVVKFARAFNLNVLEALVEAEFITEEEADLKEITVGGPALSEASNEELVKEFLYRSDPHAKRLFNTETGEESFEASLHIAPSPVSEPRGYRDDLASRRAGAPVSGPSASLHDDDDGVVREFDYSPDEYAADSSPNEQEEREKRGEDLID